MPIAKGKNIAHGFNALNYALAKKDSEILRINNISNDVLLQDNRKEIAQSCWNSMQQSIDNKVINTHGGVQLKNTLLRFELSPSKEESAQLKTTADWEKLLDDWISHLEEPFEVKLPNGKLRNTHLDIRNSKYVAVIHRDTDKPHIHLEVCRVDENGLTNVSEKIGERSAKAMNELAKERGWKQASKIQDEHIKEIHDTAMKVLASMKSFDYDVYAQGMKEAGFIVDYRLASNGKYVSYGINYGNCRYTASEVGRDITCAHLPKTWLKVQEEQKQGQKVEQENHIAPQNLSSDKGNLQGGSGGSNSDDEQPTMKIVDADFFKDKESGRWKMLFVSDSTRFFIADISTHDKNSFFSFAQGKSKEETFDTRISLANKYVNEAKEKTQEEVKDFFTQDDNNSDRTLALLTRLPIHKEKEEKGKGEKSSKNNAPMFVLPASQNGKQENKENENIKNENLSDKIFNKINHKENLINMHQNSIYKDQDALPISFQHNGSNVTLHILNSDLDKVFKGIDSTLDDASSRKSYLPLAASLLEIDKLQEEQQENENAIFQFGDISSSIEELIKIYVDTATDLSGKPGGGGVHGQLSRWDGKRKDDKPFFAGQSAVNLMGGAGGRTKGRKR